MYPCGGFPPFGGLQPHSFFLESSLDVPKSSESAPPGIWFSLGLETTAYLKLTGLYFWVILHVPFLTIRHLYVT